jgi:leader peptidase (prepilin peptidase)/N-methyltransferase
MLQITPFLTVYTTVVAFLLGTVMASFLGCLGWRMCKGESVLHGRSHCDSCGHVLGARDLIPILSYLINKGRCRHCGEKISKMNLYGEVGMGVLFAVTTLVNLENGNLYLIILHLFFFCILYLVTVTDMIDQIIPDSALLVAIVVRVIGFVLNYKFDWNQYVTYVEKPALWSELIRLFVDGLAVSLPLLILVLIMEKVLKKETMGGGDIKLLFVTGLYLGWARNILVIFLACIIGIVMGLVQQRGTEETEEDSEESNEQSFYFAFGPSIALSAVLVLFLGNKMIEWYMSLF